jgi:N-acetylmuramoyl-L-alanine amidase
MMTRMRAYRRKRSAWIWWVSSCCIVFIVVMALLIGRGEKDTATEPEVSAVIKTVEEDRASPSVTPLPFRVCLDVGHGGDDPGALSGNRQEKDDTLKMALRVQEILEEQGVECLLTRTAGDTTLSSDERCNFANQEGVAFLVSLHRNSGNGYGLETWIHSKPSKRDKALANNIHKGILQVCKFRDRGIKSGSPKGPKVNLPMNEQTNMPSCLIEIGFINSEADNKMFDESFEEIAAAIAQAIMDSR